MRLFFTQMRWGRSDRLFLSSSVCVTKYRLKCRCYIWASLRSAPRAWCRTVGDIHLRLLYNLQRLWKQRFLQQKTPISLAFFLRGKKWRYSPIKLDNFAGQWPVTGINFEAWVEIKKGNEHSITILSEAL